MRWLCSVNGYVGQTFGDVATCYRLRPAGGCLPLNSQPQRGREVLRWVVPANAHASPVRLGLVLWQHALHLVPALVVQHAQSEKYLVTRITRKKSSDKRSFIWVHKIPQHVSVIIIGQIDSIPALSTALWDG